MAHLVRQKRTRYYLDGVRVPAGTPGARKVTERGKLWYGVGIPGRPPKKRVPLATDREAAERMLGNMVRAAEKGIAAVPDRKAAAAPLAEHLTAFRSAVAMGLATKGARLRRPPDGRQVALVVQRVRDLCDGCGFEYPADLNADAPARLAAHLHDRMGRPRTAGERGISAQTANFVVAAARRFARWMHERVSTVRPDLFDRLPAFDAANARKHARRDISPEDLGRVFEAARASEKSVLCLPGPERYHLYLVAFSTGFRASELAALAPEHFHLDAESPAVSLPGKVAKNKKAARLPLVPGVAVALRAYLTGKEPGRPVWPGKWAKHAARLLRADLAAAGVPYCVEGENGKEYADFHALRHTFCSALAASGAGVKELQALARHGDSRTTLNLYTHARSAELARAIGRLQVPGAAPAASPLAGLGREELEGLVLGLVVLLGSVLNPPGPAPGTPPGTPAAGIPGDSGGHLDTKGRARKRSG